MSDTQHLDQALLAVYRYGDWKGATLHMTDEQREAAAQAVERAGYSGPGVRWWEHHRAADPQQRMEQLAAALGLGHVPTLSPAEQAALDTSHAEAERTADDFYNDPGRRAAA